MVLRASHVGRCLIICNKAAAKKKGRRRVRRTTRRAGEPQNVERDDDRD